MFTYKILHLSLIWASTGQTIAEGVFFLLGMCVLKPIAEFTAVPMVYMVCITFMNVSFKDLSSLWIENVTKSMIIVKITKTDILLFFWNVHTLATPVYIH